MKLLTDLLLSAVRVVEAEMRDLKRGAIRAGGTMALLWLAVLLAAGGIGLLVASAFIAISGVLGPSIAALLTGCGVLILAVCLAAGAKWLT